MHNQQRLLLSFAVAVLLAARFEPALAGTPMIGAAATMAVVAATHAGTISGDVKQAVSGHPVIGARIHVYDDGGVLVSSTVGAGIFVTDPLDAGSYHLVVDAPHHQDVAYPDIVCPGECDPSAGTPIVVGAGDTSIGIVVVPRIPVPLEETQILYVNRCDSGCIVHPGVDNVFTNTSSIPTAESTLPAFALGDQTFDDVLTCMRRVFAPYPVIVTDVDPGDLPHRELMLAGSPTDIQEQPGIGGIAPYYGGFPVYNTIAFAFANAIGDDVVELCNTATHEAGHLAGLDHEYYAPDTMSYLDVIGIPYFTDHEAPCGESSPRMCYCNGDVTCSTQNSDALLTLQMGDNRIMVSTFDPDDFAQPTGNLHAPRLGSGLICGTRTEPWQPAVLAPWAR